MTHSHDHAHPHTHGAPVTGTGQLADVPTEGSRRTVPAPEGACIAYLDCFAGASGDMLLGALLDAGLTLTALEAELGKLALSGYELSVERERQHGLTGTKLRVVDTLQAYPARHLHDIHHLLEDSGLSDGVKQQSASVFERLGRAEAGIHGIPLEEVHFHEVGAVDTIVDIVGFAAGLEILGVDRVYASAIPLGSGTIEIAHGRFPVPVPATLALLSSVGAPTLPHPSTTEIVTPTGAALVTQFASFGRPPMRVRSTGYGFGSKVFPWPNALRVWIGERSSAPDHLHDEVVEMECNLDDVTGEALGYTMERLFAAGALDVWFTPVQMKKNRPGVMLSLLSPVGKTEQLSLVLMRETTTLGVRLFPPAHRLKADRRLRQVDTPWGKVQVKEKWLGDQRLAVSPEYEDCARLARASGEPLVRIMDVARQVAEQS